MCRLCLYIYVYIGIGALGSGWGGCRGCVAVFVKNLLVRREVVFSFGFFTVGFSAVVEFGFWE